ncbi:MAG: tetratricopeptide repeat protein [Treponema sp.]|nr:tetratricopeptide repeat protein [Treponema sp.]
MINIKRPLHIISNKIRGDTHGVSEEKWTADFSKPEKTPFDIKTESAYFAYLSNKSLALCLKKTNCLAWVDVPDRDYQDHIVEAEFRLDSMGGYIAAGLMFRITGEDSYYLALVSNKGFFRLDAVKDNSPRTLIAWTEVAGLEPTLKNNSAKQGDPADSSSFDGITIKLKIIAYGTYLTFLVNDRWIGEINDDTVPGGRPGFALASYEAAAGNPAASLPASKNHEKNTFICRAWLDYFSVDFRIKSVEECYTKWKEGAEITAESRLRFAETLAVMGEALLALEQLNMTWLKREEAARSVGATYTETRARKELLLASRMASRLGQYDEAEEFIDACLEQGYENNDGKEALNEKMRIMGEKNKFAELKDFILKYSDYLDKNSEMYSLLGRSHWEAKEYELAAKAWDKAFELESENGVHAVNAASALEQLGKKKDGVLDRFLEAGKIFLRQGNQAELAALIPRLIIVGETNWEARVLAGKWAFSVEDYERSESELAVAERLRRKVRPVPPADPAASYLRGLIHSFGGRYKNAVRYLKEAINLAPEYGLFRFKLAENLIYENGGVYDPKFADEMRLALNLMDDADGQTANYGGTLLFEYEDLKNARYFFSKALSAEPDNIEYLSNMHKCLIKMGQFSEAEELLIEAKRRKPSAELMKLIWQVS